MTTTATIADRPNVDYTLDTTKLITPNVHFMPYIFTTLKTLKAGESMAVVAQKPFILSPNFSGTYDTSVQQKDGKFTTTIIKKAA